MTPENHVEHIEGVCGGRAIIAGHRIPVWQIAKLANEGASTKEIEGRYMSVNTQEVRNALKYYHSHKEEIERDIEANSLESVKSLNLPNFHVLNGRR